MAVRRGTTTASKGVTTSKPRAAKLVAHIAQPASKGQAKRSAVVQGSRASTGRRG